MSTYLCLYMKEKKATTIDNAPCILYFNTTMARELAFELKLKYTDGEIFYAFNDSHIQCSLEFFRENVSKIQHHIKDAKEDLDLEYSLLPKCENQTVFESMCELCETNKQNLSDLKSQLEENVAMQNILGNVATIVNDEDNKQFELVYTLG